MTYFCFVESDTSDVPHMEPLDADTLDAALREAEHLLKHHTSGVRAHIVRGEERVATVRADRQTS